jgi:hypothetical protein
MRMISKVAVQRASPWAALVMGAVVASGCIVHKPLALPVESDTGWSETKSTHFRLVTDLDAEDADAVLRTFERTYRLLAKVLFAGDAAPDFETQVIAFRTEGELHEFVPPPYTGRYMARLPNDLQSVPTVVMAGKPSPFNRMLLAHELTHRFNHVAFQSMPIWLNEGLAEYFSTVRGDIDQPVVGELDPENGFASGSVRSDRSHVIYQNGLIDIDEVPPPSTLMQLDRDNFYTRDEDLVRRQSLKANEKIVRNYVAAWAFTHMLMQSDRGVDLRRALETPSNRQVLPAALRSLAQEGAEIDREFDTYLRTPIHWRQHHEGPPPPLTGVSRRPLTTAEVLAWWTRLDAFEGRTADRSSRRLEDGATRWPGDPDLEFLRGRRDMMLNRPRAAEDHLKQALARRPGDSGFQLALALLYLSNRTGTTWPQPERDALLSQAFEKLGEVAQTSAELNTVAIYHMMKKTPPRALPFAQRASRVDPDCWSCLHTYAAATYEMGSARDAAELERSALERLPDDAPSKVTTLLTQDRDRYVRAASGANQDRQGTMLFLPD